jgi:hypothetical protein
MQRSPLFSLLPAIAAVCTIAFGCEKNGQESPGTRQNTESPELVILSDTGTDIDSKAFDNTGGEVTIIVGSNYSWTASVEEGKDWVVLDIEEDQREGGKYGDSRVTVIVAPSYDEAERTAVITFTAGEKTATFTVIQGATFLDVDATAVDISHVGETQNVDISTNALDWSPEVVSGGDWCSVVKNGNAGISITAEANNGNERVAVLRITAGTIVREITVTQSDYQPPYEDKEVVQVQKATKGDGIELILMGEGYTARDMAKGAGKYHKDMYAAIEHFFSVYPYNAYREYFNIWIVGAVSTDEGMSVMGKSRKNTVFKLLWDSRSTGIGCDGNGNGKWDENEIEDQVIRTYTRLVSNRADVNKDINDMTVIMPINMDVYAGTCMMTTGGYSYAMCPANKRTAAGTTFESTVIHEAGGHGFAGLFDEYIYYPNQSIDSDEKASIRYWKQYGFSVNLDVDSGGNVTQTEWAPMAASAKYSLVGSKYSRVNIWEGGNYFGRGIWRPESNSCMNDNVPYFNAPSRWAAVRRIKKLSGVDSNYTIAEFMADDVIPQYPEWSGMGTRSPEPFIPLGRPILVE